MRLSKGSGFGLCCLALAACGGAESGTAHGADGGTLVIAAPGEAETLFPLFVNSTASKQIVDQIFDHLADLGPDLNTIGDRGFRPRAATSWEWSADSSTVTFHLDPAATWHDGKPVRAADVVFSYGLYVDPVINAWNAPNIPPMDSVREVDSLSVAFRFKQRTPERFFQLVTNIWLLPRHLIDSLDRKHLASSTFARNPVGSGPFKFVRWEPRSVIELIANTAYPQDRPPLDRVVFAYAENPPTAAKKVVAGEADLVEVVRPEYQESLIASPTVRIDRYRAFDVGYLLYNLTDRRNRAKPHPILGNRALRLALAMAFDRASAIRNVYDTLAVESHGPFVQAQWSADTTIPVIPYDTVGAVALLDSLGWKDTNGDGVRDKDGRPLRLDIAFPAPSSTRRRLSVILQEQWKRVGVDAVLRELDFAPFVDDLQKGDFDVVMHGWHYDASPSSLEQAWGGKAFGHNSNYGRYANPYVDSLIPIAMADADIEKAKNDYHAIYRTIVADVPAVFVYETKPYLAVHKRVVLPPLTSDSWWADIRDWSIPVGKRIDRDKVGLPATR